MLKNKGTKKQLIIPLSIIAAFACLSVIGFVVYSIFIAKPENAPIQSQSVVNQSSETESIKEPEFIETYATIANIGDIMVHDPQLEGAFISKEKGYDFSDFFKNISSHFESADLAVANLEVTFGGNESRDYSGYPAFNCPDELASTIKESGLDIILTSNNHSYDTGYSGFLRTQEVLEKNEITYTGTVTDSKKRNYLIEEVNNIKIGMANFTYETEGDLTGRKYLNGILLKQEANELINSFSYNRLDEFYNQAKNIVSQMKEEGAEYIVFYMHWGDEYKTYPNSWQKRIAQELSNIGINMIIGGHPHVIQPMEVITSEDNQNKTICIYSLGNAISNQRKERMDSCPTGHTEDGLLFSYTLVKDENGVSLRKIEIIPTWVDKYLRDNQYKYTIYPIKSTSEISKFDISDSSKQKAYDSYKRTTNLLFSNLRQCEIEADCEIIFK